MVHNSGFQLKYEPPKLGFVTVGLWGGAWVSGVVPG